MGIAPLMSGIGSSGQRTMIVTCEDNQDRFVSRVTQVSASLLQRGIGRIDPLVYPSQATCLPTYLKVRYLAGHLSDGVHSPYRALRVLRIVYPANGHKCTYRTR